MTKSFITRRHLTGIVLAISGLGACSARSSTSSTNKDVTYLVGNYDNPKTPGVTVVTLKGTGQWQEVAHFDGVKNASFIVFDPKSAILYVTEEVKGQVGAFKLSSDLKSLTPLGYLSSGAEFPCYLSFSPDKTRLAVANYGSDCVAIFKIDPTSGALQPNPQILRGIGEGPAGHAHWVQWSPEGNYLYIVDLGRDEIRMHKVEAGSGDIGPVDVAARLAAGTGPRHLVFHPYLPFAYLLAEYANTITTFRREADARLTSVNEISSLPALSLQKSFAAHLSINKHGTTIYATNRGSNSVASFTIGEDGQLSPLQTLSSGGNWPRLFLLDENAQRLLMANQKGDTIVPFSVATNGKLNPSGKPLATGMPVAILRLTP